MSTPLQDYSALIGRFLLAVIFLMSGMGKIGDFAGTTEYMLAHGMPMASVFLIGAIVFEIVGGLSLITGYKAKYGALMLIVFLIPATLIFHNFWTVPEDMFKLQMIMFLKNLAIAGGLLVVYAFGPGKLSLGGIQD